MKTKRMTCVCGFLVVLLGLGVMAREAMGQTGDTPGDKAATASKSNGYDPHPDTRPYQVFYLTNATQQNEANEVVVAVRNLLDPSVRIFLVPNQNAILLRATPEQMALVQKVINDLDRPKKVYRLTYAITEMDGGKRVGVQHYSMVVTSGQRTVMKQGNKVPVATGSSSATQGAEAQTQFTYVDVGMNFEATLEQSGNGARLKTKVEQLGIGEERSGLGPQDPVLRQTSLEGTSFLMPGKPVILGSLDVPGSTRHLDVDVMMDVVNP
jgi:type II secretory pathway component GspD/PulD (secretin)